MPETLVSTDSAATTSSVDAVVAVFGRLREGDADARAAATTACPPRLMRVVAFMSADRAIARVEEARTAQDARREVADA